MAREDVVFIVSLALFIVLLVVVGSWIVATIYRVIHYAFPVLRNTVFDIDAVIAFASFFVIVALNIYMRAVNRVITWRFCERIGVREWIRSALRDNRNIILKFMCISMVISIALTSIEYGMLRRQALVPVFGIYQDVAISGVIIFAVFDLWIVTFSIIFYDLMQ